MDMKEIHTISDIGSVKLYTKDAAFLIDNGIGDCTNRIEIYEEPQNVPERFKLVCMFAVTVPGTVRLSQGDCEDTPVYTFQRTGRYMVFRDTRGDEEYADFIIMPC